MYPIGVVGSAGGGAKRGGNSGAFPLRAETMAPPARGMHSFCTRDGQPYTTGSFNSIWQGTMRRDLDIGALESRIRFNGFRRKAASDAEREHGR